MSTMEHLFMQIFERKGWIEGQLRRQTESYGQSLAYNLIADGGRPPPWLWTAGSDAGSRPDTKELNREQLISEILLPISRTATPLANHNNLFSLRALKGDHVSTSQSNTFFPEMCEMNNDFNEEQMFKSLPNIGSNSCEGGRNVTVESEAEACAEFNQFSRIQRSRSRQRDLETRSSRKAKRANHLAEGSAMNEYTGRMTRSKLASLKVDCDKQSLNSSVLRDETGGRVTRSRFKVEKHGSLAKSIKPAKPADSVEDAPFRCSSGIVAYDLASDAAYPVHSGLKVTPSLIEPKKLPDESIEVCGLNEKSSVSVEKENLQCCPDSLELLEVVQSVKEDSCRNFSLSREQFLEKDVMHTGENTHMTKETDGISKVTPEEGGVELHGIEDTDCTLHPTLCNEHSEEPTLSPIKAASLASENISTPPFPISGPPLISSINTQKHASTKAISFTAEENCSDEFMKIRPEEGGVELDETEDADCTSHPTLCNEHSEEPTLSPVKAVPLISENISTSPSPIRDRLLTSSINIQKHAMEEKCSGKFMKILSTEACSPPETNFLVEGEHHRIRELNLKKMSAVVSEKDHDGSHNAVPSTNFETVQPIKELFSRDAIAEHVYLENRLPQGKDVLTAEVNSGEKVVVSDGAQGKDRCELLKEMESECYYHASSNSRPSQIHAMPSLEVVSRDSGNEWNNSSTVKDCTLSSASDLSGHGIVLPDATQKCSLTSPIESMGKLTREITDSPVQVVNTSSGNVSALKDDLKASESITFKPGMQCSSESRNDFLDAENSIEYEIPKFSYGYDDLIKERESCDGENSFPTNYQYGFSSVHDDLIGSDKIMPEFEGFSIGVSCNTGDENFMNDSDLPRLTKERISMLEHLCNSSSALTPGPCPSTKYKIHKVPDVYQSLPSGIVDNTNSSSAFQFDHGDMGQLRASENGWLSSLRCNLGSDFDGSFVETAYSHSLPSSSANSEREARKPPLTPPVGKFVQKMISERSLASSEKVGSSAELTCFRIDEDSNSTEGDGHLDVLQTSGDMTGSRTKLSVCRKALVDVITSCPNSSNFVSKSKKFLERGSLESINTESSFGTYMGMRNGYPSNKKAKTNVKEGQSLSFSGKRVLKAADSLHKRPSKAEISVKANDRNKSQAKLLKGCKPTNIVSNISSFVPLVRQKQQEVAAMKGKKDMKVKALEAAEAAKLLEEKKQNEREMRKAAAKQERERLEQENAKKLELKQKRIEDEKRKKEAEIAAKKRQRDEEERKKGRQRRCIEEARKHPGTKEGRSHPDKENKELQNKAVDEKETRKTDAREEVKEKPKPEKGVPCDERHLGNSQNDAPKNSNDVAKVNSTGEEIQKLESYEMSPYFDSDNEDGDEKRREGKYVPLWARRDSISQTILSKKDLDPCEIFRRKGSFSLNEVLTPRIRLRPFVTETGGLEDTAVNDCH